MADIWLFNFLAEIQSAEIYYRITKGRFFRICIGWKQIPGVTVRMYPISYIGSVSHSCGVIHCDAKYGNSAGQMRRQAEPLSFA